MTSKIEISHRTIVFILGLLALLWLIVQIREILFLLFISFILMSTFRPLIDRWEKWRLPRALGILLLYGIVFGLFSSALAGVIPSLVIQSTRLMQSLPGLVTKLLPYWDINLQSFIQQAAPLGENIVRLTVGIFSNIVTTITVLVFTFYFLLERSRLEKFLLEMLGAEVGKRTIDIIQKVEKSLGSWLLGEFVLMFCIGLFSYLGLLLLKVDFALPLAILAGLLEIVPTIGPIISGIPAVLVALTTSPLLALATVALYFILHQTENNLLVPLVMRKAVGLPPLVTIVALMVGGKLAGLAGAVLAVPIVVMLQVILSELLAKKT